MVVNPLNSSSLEQLALKGLIACSQLCIYTFNALIQLDNNIQSVKEFCCSFQLFEGPSPAWSNRGKVG